MCSAKSVSRVILNFCKKHNIKISCVYLQSLLYLIQEYFCCFDEMCLIDEEFRAYSFGPAVKEVLDDFEDITATIDYNAYRSEAELPLKINAAVIKYLEVHFSNRGDGNIFFVTNRVRSHKPYYEALNTANENDDVTPVISQRSIVDYCKELIEAAKQRNT